MSYGEIPEQQGGQVNMKCTNQFLAVATSASVAFLLVLAFAPSAGAQDKGKSTQTEAQWVSFDAAGETITVKVKKPGKGPNAKLLRRGKEVAFKVKKEGSVLTRTTVAINGKKGEIEEINAGKTVFVYWRLLEGDVMFARKIDVIFSEEEFEARYKPVDE